MAIVHPQARALYAKWNTLIKKYTDIPNMEIEIRFGRRSKRGFNTNVGKCPFFKAMSSLGKFKAWESKTHTSSTVYYGNGSKRLMVDDETGEHLCIIKKRVLVDDFILEDAQFDVRLGISAEEPFECDGGVSTRQTTKQRWSFIRKNLSIDLTIVKAPNEETVYQIEMEIIDPKLLSGKGESLKIISKVFDLLKCL